jgi:hypothetical protein
MYLNQQCYFRYSQLKNNALSLDRVVRTIFDIYVVITLPELTNSPGLVPKHRLLGG